MNKHYVIYNKDTGEITQSVFCQSTVIDLYTKNGELGAIETDGMIDPSCNRVESGAVVPFEVMKEVPVSEQRMYAYPSVGEQLDCLWHAMDKGILPKIEPMYSQVKAVKDSIPKVK